MIKIGRKYYHKFERIGKGSYSTVYKGYCNDDNNIYAIKEIDIELNKSNINRFYLEIQLMRRLEHNNIIKLYDTHENDKYIYIIMEYCKYGDLRLFINRKPLNEYKTQIIMRQIINGMEYIYNNKVFHRDLKPQNILVTDNCIIKITDFGLAKECEENNLSDTICGSPIYMAPEILQNIKYNNKADIWSIGVIFYELLTGETPYKVKQYNELIDSIKHKDIKIPSYLKISNNARDLLKKLLIKTSDNRITWNEIFIHPWIKTDLNNSILFKSKISNINKNNNKNNKNNKSLSNLFKNSKIDNNFCNKFNIFKNSKIDIITSNTFSNSMSETIEENNILSDNLINDNIILNNSNSFNESKYNNKISGKPKKNSINILYKSTDSYTDINIENDNILSDSEEDIFTMEINNYKKNKLNNTFNNYYYNESSGSDINMSQTSNNKYDFINESFSKYDENIDYIQQQNNSNSVVNKIHSFIVKSFIKKKK